jgi:hypothetical protein
MTIEAEGFFHLSNRPGNEIAGRLTFDADEGGKLALIGSLDTNGSAPRIVGHCDSGLYTLDDCFVIRSQGSGSIRTQLFHVGRIFGGVAYDESEEPVFDRFDIGLANLIEWVGPPKILEDFDFDSTVDNRQKRIAVMLDPWESRQIALQAGNLQLCHTHGMTGDRLRQRTLTQNLSFSLGFDRTLQLADIIDVASDLQDLVSIGVDRAAGYDYVDLYHSDLGKDLPSGKRVLQPVRFIVPWLAQADTKKKPPAPSDMAFTFDDLGGMDGVARWLSTAAKYRSMLGQVMNTRYTQMLVDVKLNFRIAALHGLHREWKGFERTLNVALTQLVELAGEPFGRLVPDVEVWCRKITSERNNLAITMGGPCI